MKGYLCCKPVRVHPARSAPAIEDASQSHSSIAERFGVVVADIVRNYSDTSEEAPAGEKEP